MFVLIVERECNEKISRRYGDAGRVEKSGYDAKMYVEAASLVEAVGFDVGGGLGERVVVRIEREWKGNENLDENLTELELEVNKSKRAE